LGGPDRSEEHALCALAWLGWKTPRNRWDWTALLARELAVHCVLRTFRPRAAGSDARSRLSDAAVAASLLTQRYYFQNDVLSMTATALLGINAAERSGAGGPAARAYTTMGLVAGLARLRRLSSGYFRDAHRKAEGDLSEIVMAFATEIVAAGTIGRWPQTQAIGRNLADIFTSLKDPLIRGMALATLCWVEFFGERDAAAERRARELISLGRESDNAQYVGWGTYYCARVALRACQYDTALPLLTQALATLENFNERQSSINIVGSLAISHLRTGDPKKALASADQALDYLAGSSPTGFSSLDGPVLAAQVYRELLSVAPPNQRRHLAARWRMARRWLWWLAALFPVAQPSAWLEAGHAFAFKRRTGAARFSFEASRRAAAKYGMTRDCNQAEAALEALRPR
jgi:tetratricopeptide (TPR) repeat protein